MSTTHEPLHPIDQAAQQAYEAISENEYYGEPQNIQAITILNIENLDGSGNIEVASSAGVSDLVAAGMVEMAKHIIINGERDIDHMEEDE